MIELPEARVLTAQINQSIYNRKIIRIQTGKSPHKFAWLSGDQKYYENLLLNKQFGNAVSYGGLIELDFESSRLLFGDGVNLRFSEDEKSPPDKHQLLIEFDDHTFLTAGVQMYGGMWGFKKDQFDYKYYLLAREFPLLLEGEFSEDDFIKLSYQQENRKLSVKALLATEQRIPGLGNGVLQDILFNAGIHPKNKVQNLQEEDLRRLYQSIIRTLTQMTDQGGRDTEKDLFGNNGGYLCLMSKNTVGQACPKCGAKIIKENYMGGSVYYCSGCQK